MRVIVCPHDMGMGGSQLNALDLAAEVQRLGHDVMLYAPPGPLGERAEALGLSTTAAGTGRRLSATWAAGLVRLARRRHPDIIHTYEWAPSVGAAFGAHVLLGVPQVVTVLSMDIPRFLPRHLDLVVGTRQLSAEAACFPRRHVMEPPIDTGTDLARDRLAARRRLDLPATDIVIAVVGRMTTDLDKSAGVLSAIEAVDRLAENGPVTLIAAGDGPELARIRSAAERVNNRHGRTVVRTPGFVADPRAVYEAADIVAGMGSSVLRGMSFGRPCVVLGAAGFCRSVTAATIGTFAWEGFYGIGDGGRHLLGPELDVLMDPAERARVGAWSRRVVEEEYSLSRAAKELVDIYTAAVARHTTVGRTALSLARSAAGLGSYALHRTLRTQTGPAPTKPVGQEVPA